MSPGPNPRGFAPAPPRLYRTRTGATIAQIAEELGINRETLHGWIRKDGEETRYDGRRRQFRGPCGCGGPTVRR
ncbi:helix-turn-helix domain-containing protein [Nocardiopsis terrae]|uniref:helix-turn-helix domain-containing protein n=1 Tax=Nocardiopsis terrae TaxID=372655 RepID=UPI001747FCDF